MQTRRVIVPDHEDLQVNSAFTPEEVRRNLIQVLGLTFLQNAQYRENADGSLEFFRAAGGDKGR
jgi:hypothetical protein